MSKFKRLITSEEDRQRVLAEISMMSLDAIKMVQFGDATRTDMQNAKFHAICGDASKQAQWMGRSLDVPQWKCLFVSGHAIATGLGSEMVPGLRVNL
ncbi:recombination protein NinB [Chromobacterium haemolyticum]|nr:recombination protein NinB [Chromobacterium haemolyticum]